MWKRTMLLAAVAVVGIGVVGAIWSTVGPEVLARQDHPCMSRGDGHPAMGTPDPNAPYDLRFIDEMIMHHQGAIMSTEMMIKESGHAELRGLARRIQESQQRQIDQMREWRAAWYPDAGPSAMDMDAIVGMPEDRDGGMMGGSMMPGMMAGDQSDHMFLRMMIPHHQLAIEMSEDALRRAEHQELKGLAEAIIRGQSAEIAEMERYLEGWYGTESSHNSAGGMHDMIQSMMNRC